jgi:tripeptidyl-peptidase-1
MDETINVIVALKQQNIGKLESLVRRVSDPFGEHYGQYLTQSELGELIAPSEASQQAVAEWLVAELGVQRDALSWVAHRDVVTVAAPRHRVESAFDVSFGVWRSPSGRRITRSQRRYTMPAALAPHVDLVHNLSDFPHFKRRGARPSTSSSTVVDQTKSFSSPLKSSPPVCF